MTLQNKITTKYVANAATQHHLLKSRLVDKGDVEQGWKIHYAIDSNVAVLYTNAPRQLKTNPHFMQVFDDDSVKTIKDITRATGTFLFFELTKKNQPLIVFPPSAIEIQDMFYAVAVKAEAEFSRSSDIGIFQKLVDYVNKFRLNSDNHDKFLDDLINRHSTALKVLYSDEGTATGELRRFTQIINNRLITTLEYFIENYDEQNANCAYLKNVVDIYKNLDEDELNDLADEWYSKRLRKYNDNRPDDLIDRDAVVISTIELINKRLSIFKEKLVYITGDELLRKCGSEYYQLNSKQSFSDKYIRHPKSYIGEIGLNFGIKDKANRSVDVNSNEKIDLYDWFQVFLGPFVDCKLNEIGNKLETIDQNKLKKHSHKENELRQQWDGLTRIFAARGAFVSEKAELEVAAKHLLNELQENSIQQILNTKAEELWNSFFKIAAEEGHGLFIARDRQDFPARSVPALRLDFFPAANNYLLRVFKSDHNGYYDKTEKKMLKALKDEDPSYYSYYLAVGLFFYSISKWKITKILADRALKIADNKSITKRVNIYGHEAAYLYAVASRVTSRRPRQLLVALKAVDNAYSRIKEFRNDPSTYDIRYESEKISLCLSFHLYRIFMKQDDGIENDFVPLTECLEYTIKTINHIKNEQDNIILKKTGRQLYANLFLCLILLKYKSDEKFSVPGNISDLLADFKKSIEETTIDPGISFNVSLRVQSIYLSSEIIFGNTDGKILRENLFELLNDQAIDKLSILPYDKERYYFLKQIALNKL